MLGSYLGHGTQWLFFFVFLSYHTVHGVLVVRTLEWFAIPFSSGPMFCQNLPLWPVHFGWPWITWLIDSLSYASAFATTRLWSLKGFHSMESEQTPGDLKDREAWCAAVHGVTKSQIWLSDWTTKRPRAPAWKSTWISNDVDPTHGFLLQITIHVPGYENCHIKSLKIRSIFEGDSYCHHSG